jgi:CRISPR system Cascade subunit CasA
MNPSDNLTFDLIHQPWIRVRDLDGGTAERGILQALGLAHQLAGLSGDVPTQTFALTRMLLAVLHGALAGPRDDDAWVELWEAERLPTEMIAAYLAEYRERFDLFHPKTPFFQVAGLHTASGKTTGTPTLIADVPNGTKFFTTRVGVDYTLTYAEAARWLVHCQAFDISGIKTGAVGDERVKDGKGYPIGVAWAGLLGCVLLEGATLKETLLLNLMPRDFGDYAREPHEDRPAWEREPVSAAEEVPDGRPVTGPVDLYTWQSRRVRLISGPDRCVRDALICNGERLTPQNMHRAEPHTAWRRSTPQEKALRLPLVYMPREHDPDRATWRGLASLPESWSSDRARGAGGAVREGRRGRQARDR